MINVNKNLFAYVKKINLNKLLVPTFVQLDSKHKPFF